MNEMQRKIDAMLKAEYENPQFESFVTELMELGIHHVTWDAFKNEMSFYTDRNFVHTSERLDLKGAGCESWPVAKELDLGHVEKAIHLLDTKKISSIEFHKELSIAGVVFAILYMRKRKIYYMGLDGKYYLESY